MFACHFGRTTLLALTLLSSVSLFAQNQVYKTIDAGPFQDAAQHWYGIFDKENVIFPRPDRPRYANTELAQVADNILLFQKENGGWPKNYDIFAILSPEQKDSLTKVKGKENTTFDNGTTWSHVECLARVYEVTGHAAYREACIRGIRFILKSQYPSGGWPQYFPLKKDYSRHITFNDGVFTGIMNVLRQVVEGQSHFSFVDASLRKQVVAAYEKGLECILKTQIQLHGKLTAWCQQHDENTMEPAWARAFEPPAICNGESCDLVLMLMSLKNPDARTVRAIQGAVRWFAESKILNTRVQTIAAAPDTSPYRISRTDRVVVNDPAAPPIWTRYYELSTGRPLFCNRDSKVVYSLAEVARERRDGYAWYTYSPQKVIDRYKSWQEKYDPSTNKIAQ